MLIADLIVWDLLDFELGNNSSREVANCYFRVGKLLVSVGKLKNYRLPKKNNIHQKYDFESKYKYSTFDVSSVYIITILYSGLVKKKIVHFVKSL